MTDYLFDLTLVRFWDGEKQIMRTRSFQVQEDNKGNAFAKALTVVPTVLLGFGEVDYSQITLTLVRCSASDR